MEEIGAKKKFSTLNQRGDPLVLRENHRFGFENVINKKVSIFIGKNKYVKIFDGLQFLNVVFIILNVWNCAGMKY